MISLTQKNTLKALGLFVLFPFLLLLVHLSPWMNGTKGWMTLLLAAAGIGLACVQDRTAFRWLLTGSVVLSIVALGGLDDSSVLVSVIALLYFFIWL